MCSRVQLCLVSSSLSVLYVGMRADLEQESGMAGGTSEFTSEVYKKDVFGFRMRLVTSKYDVLAFLKGSKLTVFLPVDERGPRFRR